MKTKICWLCKKKIEVNNENFHINKASKDGFANLCKPCAKIYKRKNREKYAEKSQEYCAKYQKEHKEEIKDKRDVFYIEHKSKIIEYKNKYCAKNKKKIAIKAKKYRNENKDKIKEIRRKYNINNKDKIRITQNAYVMKNIEKIRKDRRAWVKNNKEKIYLRNNIRRENRMEFMATLTIEEWQDTLKYFGDKDAYTGLPMEVLSRDHVIPLSKGGFYSKHNIIPCECSINSSKGNLELEEWYIKQPFYSEGRLKKIYDFIGVKNELQ